MWSEWIEIKKIIAIKTSVLCEVFFHRQRCLATIMAPWHLIVSLPLLQMIGEKVLTRSYIHSTKYMPPHTFFYEKNGSESASPRIPGKIWNYGIDFLHFWWILAAPGDPKNHENSRKSQPGAPKCSQLAPRTLPGPSRDWFFMIFHYFSTILAIKKAWKKLVILFLCSLLRGLIW